MSSMAVRVVAPLDSSGKSRTTKALEEYRQALRDGAFIGLCALLKYIAEGGHLDARDMEEAALNSIDEAIQKTNRGMKRNGLEGVKSIFQDGVAPAMTDTFPFGPTKEVCHGGKRTRAVSARVQGADGRACEIRA